MDCSSHGDMVSCYTLVYQGNGLTYIPSITTTLSPSFYKTNDSELFISFPPDGYISPSKSASLNAKIAAIAPSSYHVHKVSMIMEQLYAENYNSASRIC